MQRQELVDQLKGFISTKLLEGEDVGLDASTSLLDQGLINSMSIQMLVRFVRDRFSLEIPTAELTAANLATIDGIANLIERLK
jgi:acyl carrier protein